MFENTSDMDRGYFSVNIQKRYKDKEGIGQNSSNFLRDELRTLEHVTRQALPSSLNKSHTDRDRLTASQKGLRLFVPVLEFGPTMPMSLEIPADVQPFIKPAVASRAYADEQEVVAEILRVAAHAWEKYRQRKASS